MLAIAFLAVPIVAYGVPALSPIWKPFLIIWAGLGLLLALSWLVPAIGLVPYDEGVPRDDLAHMIDNALRAVLAMCWIMAGLVQAIRGLARALGYTGYVHWPVVGLGGFATATVGLLFL